MVKYYKATTVSEVGSHENCASEDPTFVHPDKQNQGEREWLMKHNGGNAKENRREKPVGNCYRGRDWVMCGFLKSSGIPPMDLVVSCCSYTKFTGHPMTGASDDKLQCREELPGLPDEYEWIKVLGAMDFFPQGQEPWVL